jgi:beta-glucosidase
VAKGEVGSLLFITDPAMINRLQHIAVEKSRLHIPLIFGYDVIHGFRTIFPVPGFGNFLNQDGARASYRNSRFTGASHPESKPLLCN